MNLQKEDPMEYFYNGKKNGTKYSIAFIKMSALLSQVNDHMSMFTATITAALSKKKRTEGLIQIIEGEQVLCYQCNAF